MSGLSKKELIAQYKQRKIIGGVYAVKNIINGKIFIDCALEIKGSKNLFDFAVQNNTNFHYKIEEDWKKYGGSSFTFEILEEIKKGELQTDDEYKRDVLLLKELWLEKISADKLY
ncbi:MAG: GIY-YIG nuclease family protein [Clostridia bacterium]